METWYSLELDEWYALSDEHWRAIRSSAPDVGVYYGAGTNGTIVLYIAPAGESLARALRAKRCPPPSMDRLTRVLGTEKPFGR